MAWKGCSLRSVSLDGARRGTVAHPTERELSHVGRPGQRDLEVLADVGARRAPACAVLCCAGGVGPPDLVVRRGLRNTRTGTGTGRMSMTG